MRRYDDTIEVRRGRVRGVEAPEQFVWRGRLWLVHDVLAHWVETGAWWRSAQARQSAAGDDAAEGSDLLAEREVWRVDAAYGRAGYLSGAGSSSGSDGAGGSRGRAAPWSRQRGIFDLVFDWGRGVWRLQSTTD